MTYNEFVILIKSVADSVNADGLFLHGRNFDLTLEFNKVFPQIHLYPFTQSINSDNTNIVNTQANVGFWVMDGHESTIEQRQSFIAQMDDLSLLFENELRTRSRIQVMTIRREPQYLMYMGVLSGVALNININSGRSC
jgi:hypothetical protein